VFTGSIVSGSVTHSTWKCAAGCWSKKPDGKKKAGNQVVVARQKVSKWIRKAGITSAFLIPLAFSPANATTTLVPAQTGALAAAIAAASPGDVLELAPGLHTGPVTIDRSLTLRGSYKSIIDSGGKGSTITIGAADVVVRGITIRNSGRELATMDSGIFVNKSGHRALVEQNRIVGNLFGVYLWGPKEAIARGNRIRGLQTAHVNARGNGISVWNSPGSIIENNDIRFGRDGIFSTTSKKNIFRNNRLRDTRIAIHYMYTNKSTVTGNISEGNHVGFALMFSKKLKVHGNQSIGDRDHGILLNYTNGSVIRDNLVKNGQNKCVFIYNSSKNSFLDNRFESCKIGIHFTAGSERNQMTGNAFIANATQVKYVGTTDIDWSLKGRGNYWSDNPAFDLDGNGIADTPYRPNDMVDQVVWAHPAAKLLLNSPGIQVLRWSQSRFPSLHPGGVVDSAPLMEPVVISANQHETVQ
jgi:nitrous oxidase accessory protein